MKRILLIFTCLTLLISLVACGGSDKIICRTNENVTKVAQKVVEILDGYLNLTLSLDEANESLSDLQERMETMDGVDYEDYDYNDPNYIVLRQIEMCSTIYKWDTDSELEAARDIIAFNAGIQLLKESHKAAPFEPSDYIEKREKEIMNDAGLVGLPVSSCHVIEYDDNIVITLSFDAMYGIGVSDFCDYIFEIFTKATALYGNNVSLHADLEEYKNGIISVSMHSGESEFNGIIYMLSAEEDPVMFHEKSELEKEAQRIWKNR